ncbi:Alpha/Beta hydrolase protein [Thermothelomyces heterothallicus CBS 202.75]|uniref:Alpha/Beta hydrolase protein n=1 Tax=Thermothelomyces heterothallicus CBS 202.75 TaxID=1149848 RepID=UPI0037426F25
MTRISEDCLNPNIIRPSQATLKRKDERLPVVVWFYGGGFAEVGFLGCLRAATLDEVFEAGEATGTQPTWWPTVDGDFIPQPPSLHLEAGKFPRDVSLLSGTNDDEGFVLADNLGPSTETEDQLRRLLRPVFKFSADEAIEAVLRAYPPVANSSSHLALSHAISAMLISYFYMGDSNLSWACQSGQSIISVEKPSNLVFNATETPDVLNKHDEPDIWREEGMTLWAEHPLELDLAIGWY